MRPSVVLVLLVGAFVWVGSLAPSATAATLRAIVQIKGPIVRLSDLFAGLDPGQDCTLGDAPAPGTRLVIEQPQIEAIASQFGVNWEPLGTDQTVILDRAGRVIEPATVVSMLQSALAKQYGAVNVLVTIASYQEQTIDSSARLTIEDLSADEAAGQLRAVLTASLDGMETLRLPLAGQIDRLLTLPVPARPIAAGEVIGGQDLSSVRIPASRVRGDVLEHGNDGIGLIPLRPLPAGLPISRSDLRRPYFVLRGAPIMMRLESNGIAVEAQGQALESGTLDDRVRVINPISRTVLLATVIGRSEVRIDPSSMPLVQARVNGYGSAQFGTPVWSGYSQYAPARIEGSEP